MNGSNHSGAPTGVATVVIADDHQLVREGLRVVLGASPEFTCVGEAANGQEAVDLARELHPDLIVMDLKMPVMDGISATRLIVQESPEARVVALTMYDDEASIVRALEAGARSYLLKGATHVEVVQTLRTVMSGGLVFSPGVSAAVVKRLAAATGPARPFPQLSARESEVLELLCKGVADHRIAVRLHIEQKTVRNHIASIIAKTGAHNRLDVVVRAKDAGVGSES